MGGRADAATRRKPQRRFHIKRAAESYVWDDRGIRYIDLTSGWNVVNAGWNNSEISSAWRGRAERLPFRPAWCVDDFWTALEGQFEQLTPGYVPIAGCSGGEGIDNALKIARMVTGRARVITFAGAFHGSNTGAALAAGYEVSHLAPLGLQSMNLALPATPGTAPDFGKLRRHGTRTAAIVLETVHTNTGCYVTPDDTLSRLRSLADDVGALIICDEIGTGFNRTGTLLSCQSRGLTPDIIVCGKALTNGLYPLSLCLVKSELTPHLDQEAFASTYGGAPAGCAAALATIAYHHKYDLGCLTLQSSAELRKRLFANLSGCDLFLDVYGAGLVLAVHLNWELADSIGLTPDGLLESLRSKGVFAVLSPGDCHLMIMPPLNTKPQVLMTAMDIVGDALVGPEPCRC
jgi:acetylornithine/succinyldiaminopimelate/putrescine aminotransferase